MNVPLSWLAEYVDLPKDTRDLTDKLTLVGHMLDKVHEKEGETVIDLELRGNRADMYGLIGVARDISAIVDAELKVPKVSVLKIDTKSDLVTVEKSAQALVTRFTAQRLKVKLGPSPKWLAQRLELYGVPSINNVVDVTNYVMVETGIPMHAFDFAQVANGKLILRTAKAGEEFQTIQQDMTVKLTIQDLVIADSKNPLTLTMIGGMASKVSAETSEIILEAAVYNPGSCRRSARRLKIITESGGRLEKQLDPNQTEIALARAVDLLKEVAGATLVGQVADYYPKPLHPKKIALTTEDVTRLSGLTISESSIEKILTSLGFECSGSKVLQVTVPTFRTDVESSADLVEEVVRIYGYDKIPEIPLSGSMPIPNTYLSYDLTEKLRDIMTKLAFNEVITLTMVESGEIALVNPPDPELKWLRTKIAPSLVKYAQRLTNLRQQRVAIFEIGKCFTQKGNKYQEHLSLAIALTGKTITKVWNTEPVKVTEYDLVGYIERLQQLLGLKESLNYTSGKTDGVYWAETNVDTLLKEVPAFANPYAVISSFPPVIEDVNVNLAGNYSDLVSKITKVSSLIKQIELIDKYDNKLTLRITYHSTTKQLSSDDVSSLRNKILSL